MSQYEKVLAKLLARPFKKDITFDEADGVLAKLGFVCAKKSGGSHCVYRHPELAGHISIPKTEHIKVYTIEDICDAIKALKEVTKNGL